MPTGSAGWWSGWESATTGTPRARASAAAVAVARAGELGARVLCWRLPAGGAEAAAGIVEGTLLGAYRFTRYKGGDDEDDAGRVERLVVSAGEDLSEPVSPRGRGRRGAERRARPAEHPGQRHDADARSASGRASWRTPSTG